MDLSVEIVSIDFINAREWDHFVSLSSGGTYFCTYDWWAAHDDSFFLIVRNKQQEMIAGIPFRFVSILPLINHMFRICWTDTSVLVRNDFNDSETDDLKFWTLNALVEHIRDKVIVLMLSSKVRSSDAELLLKAGFNVDKCATLLLDLTKDLDEIFRSFSKGHRNAIRRAMKSGLQIKISEGESAVQYIHDYCKLQGRLFENKRGSYSDIYHKDESYLRKILKAEYTRAFLAIAYLNNLPAAGGILVAYKNELFFYLAASDASLTRTCFASHLIEFEVIKYAKMNGFTRLDTGNIPFSSEPALPDYGTYVFKKGFGGERYEYEHGNLVLNKTRYWILWKLRKFENNNTLSSIYKFLKKHFI